MTHTSGGNVNFYNVGEYIIISCMAVMSTLWFTHAPIISFMHQGRNCLHMDTNPYITTLIYERVFKPWNTIPWFKHILLQKKKDSVWQRCKFRPFPKYITFCYSQCRSPWIQCLLCFRILQLTLSPDSNDQTQILT